MPSRRPPHDVPEDRVVRQSFASRASLKRMPKSRKTHRSEAGPHVQDRS
jgi:hypothetical protein